MLMLALFAVVLFCLAVRYRTQPVFSYAFELVTLAVAVPAILLTLLPYILPYLDKLAAAAILALMGLLVRATLKAKESKARHLALTIEAAATSGFLFVESKVAGALRGPDGKLSPLAQDAAKTAAIAAGIDYVKDHLLGDLKTDYGMSDLELAAKLGPRVDDLAYSHPTTKVVPGIAADSTSEKLTVRLPSGRELVMPAVK